VTHTPLRTGRTTIVHIGAPKTGTTAAQKFFTDAADALRARGVLYPDVCLRGFGHHDLAFLVGGGYPIWATPQPRDLASLAQDLARALRRPEPCVLLSSENFFLQPDPPALKSLLDASEAGRTAHILVHLRRQDHMAISWYNQAVKAQGYAGTFEENARDTASLWDYEAQLERWARTFGADQVHVRLYDRQSLVGGDITLDMLAALGLEAEGLPRLAAPVNTNLVRDVLEFQRQINRLPLETEKKRRFHRELIALTAATESQSLFDDAPVIGPGGRRELLELYAASNRNVARRWFGRDELFIEPLPTGPEPSPWSGPDPLRTQMIVGWLLARS